MISEVKIELDFRICKANLLKLNNAVEACNYVSVRTVLNEDMPVSIYSENCEDSTVVLVELMEILINK